MGIKVVDDWRRVIHVMPLKSLEGSVIGVDAAHYLERFLVPLKETVLSATGGWPLNLESTIANELRDIQSAGLKLHFVFHGLDSGVKYSPFGQSNASSQQLAKGFELYEQQRSADAVELFKNAGVPTPAHLFEFLKMVLHNHDIEFSVAPYSALAQLVQLENDNSQLIDAIFGPSELFIYGVQKIITRLDLGSDVVNNIENGITKPSRAFSLEKSTFSWIDRRDCLESLGHISPELFIDACVLAGSTLIEAFPLIRDLNSYPQDITLRDCVNLLTAHGGTIPAVCAHYQDDKSMKGTRYFDRYKLAITAVKHHVIIARGGSIEAINVDSAPHDLHDCIGQRLPEEVHLYIFHGMISPRVPNWLSSGIISVVPRYDGGDSKQYQNLVKEQLQSWRKQAVALLAHACNRYYLKRQITTKYWFGAQEVFLIEDQYKSLKDELRTWHVKEDLINERLQTVTDESGHSSSPLYYAVRSMADESFASKTVGIKPKGGSSLRSTREVYANVIWRFLQMRGYLDLKHQLTSWGVFLESTFKSLGSNPSKEQVEAAFIGVELLRVDLLSPNTMFENYSGAPTHGSPTDRRNCMLVSRVACLGKLRHKPTGYSGPLSRQLLAYRSIISEVRAGLRDLVEMSLLSLFLGDDADVERDREDWMAIALKLPFHEDISCALGIIVKTYLNELQALEDPTAEASRAEIKHKCQGWLAHANFEASFTEAMQLWDALYKSVSALPTAHSGQKQIWEEVNQWLSLRK